MPLDPETSGHKAYLAYLDKEMTIMGILSVFTVIVPAAVLDRTLAAADNTHGEQLWQAQGPTIAIGAFALFLAAICFYQQRATLAYHYGQIALSCTPSAYSGKDSLNTAELVHESDWWTSWRYYYSGFGAAAFGLLCFALAILRELVTGLGAHNSPWTILVLAVACIVATLSQQLVIWRYKEEYHPWTVAMEEVEAARQRRKVTKRGKATD